MSFHFVVGRWGVYLQVLYYDFDRQCKTLFGWSVLMGKKMRSEYWRWYDHESLTFQRTVNHKQVEGWFLQGPLRRTI